MQVMLSGAALMDGALMLIAANNTVPQAQTREHLAALEALGIEKIVIVQNKVDLVSTEHAQQNYRDIKAFTKGTIAENAPVIPMSALHGANLDVLLSAVQHFIPTPERAEDEDLRMMVARSFDINRPGTMPSKLRGGVLGGSLIRGKMRVGDEVVILPGLKKKSGKNTEFIPVRTKIQSINVGSLGSVEEASPGGLLGVQTEIDPSMARSDNLSGNIVAAVGSEPPVVSQLTINPHLFDQVVGADTQEIVKPIAPNEIILITVGTATTRGRVVTIAKKGRVIFDISPIIAMNPNSKIALSRQFNKRWRLIGYGEVHDYVEKEISI
jgi:translation initiation factor 2 subunit 3